MLPFTLIAGSVWGAHYRIRGCRDLPWRATSSSRLHGWMGWLAEWWMRLPGEQPQRGLGSVWPPHSLQQAGPCCLYLGGRGGLLPPLSVGSKLLTQPCSWFELNPFPWNLRRCYSLSPSHLLLGSPPPRWRPRYRNWRSVPGRPFPRRLHGHPISPCRWSWSSQAARGPGDSPGISLAAFAGEHSICIHLYKLCIENPSL